MKKKLPRSFYTRENVVEISRELLGKFLLTKINNVITGGMIVETEAYRGMDDKACHANNNKRTKRTQIFYGNGGFAYIYLCYGIHHLFNIITNKEHVADAVLIRAIEPHIGIDVMLQRRNMHQPHHSLTKGPGSMSQALGITTKHYGTDLLGQTIWLEDRGVKLTENEIASTPRIGIDYAGDHATRPWRFFVKNNPWVSGKNKKISAP